MAAAKRYFTKKHYNIDHDELAKLGVDSKNAPREVLGDLE